MGELMNAGNEGMRRLRLVESDSRYPFQLWGRVVGKQPSSPERRGLDARYEIRPATPHRGGLIPPGSDTAFYVQRRPLYALSLGVTSSGLRRLEYGRKRGGQQDDQGERTIASEVFDGRLDRKGGIFAPRSGHERLRCVAWRLPKVRATILRRATYGTITGGVDATRL